MRSTPRVARVIAWLCAGVYAIAYTGLDAVAGIGRGHCCRATRRPSRAPRHTGHPYLFRGVITCSLRDRTMVGIPTTGGATNRCTASRNSGRQHIISHPPVAVRADGTQRHRLGRRRVDDDFGVAGLASATDPAEAEQHPLFVLLDDLDGESEQEQSEVGSPDGEAAATGVSSDTSTVRRLLPAGRNRRWWRRQISQRFFCTSGSLAH